MTSKRAAFILLLLLSATSVPAQPGLWLQTTGASGPVSTTFESLVFNYLGASGQSSFRLEQLDVDALRKQLIQVRDQKNVPQIVIHCSMSDYLRILRDPEMKTLLTELHLDLMNARLFTFPFYVLKQQNAQISSGAVPFAWITLPGDQLHPVEDADMLTMLSETLGLPKSSLKIYRERGAYPAAKKLHEGDYRLIGIYEDEPSALLDEFRVNWEEELKADPVEFFPYDARRVSGQLVPVVPGRFSYAFFSYHGRPFGGDVPESLPLLAIAQNSNHPFPVLLSNAESLSAALSFAYFLMPATSVLGSDSESERRRVEQVYLLNSYLEDPESRFKSLGLLGSLLINRESAGDKSQREIYQEKCDLFQQKLKLPQTSADEILKWLGMEAPEVGKRELFSSDVSRLYEDALKQIDAALKQKGTERVRLLEKARTGLVAALRQGSRPKSVQGSRGLWSVSNYNPYYHLARVALYLQLEKRGSQ